MLALYALCDPDQKRIFCDNAFTPNKDGKNDLLTGFPGGIKAFKYMAIYNSYGEKIFRTTDHTKGWDSNYRGWPLSTKAFVLLAEQQITKGN
ncbi:MAG TPA: T9SS type B sorting domain-containing protein [Chitinophagaceae bacterium]|nr:T9SS type B sorting domain-containing protein [Chitinophagaceae bacterium]